MSEDDVIKVRLALLTRVMAMSGLPKLLFARSMSIDVMTPLVGAPPVNAMPVP